jgi:hypothetical protein
LDQIQFYQKKYDDALR